MARIRTIKPEFWTSEQIVECSPTARLLFIALWNFCDDGGVHPYALKRIKLQIFPGDNFDDAAIEALLRELITVGLLRSFSTDAGRFLYVTGWRHQKIEKPTLRWPQVNDQTEFDDDATNVRRAVAEQSPNNRRGVDDRSGTEGNGRDVSSSEGKKTHCANAAAAPAGSHDAQFCEFWEIFPKQRKKNRAEAFKRWQAALKKVTAATLVEAAREYAASEEGRGEYAKMPSTWLSKECWNDDRDAWNHTKGGINGRQTSYAVGAGQRFRG